MQALGWISILIGLLHLRNASGLLITMIGIAVVYGAWTSKKNEHALTHRVFQAMIKSTRRLKKEQGLAGQQDKRDFLINNLPTLPNNKSKGKSVQKPDWFIYTK